MVTPNKAIVPNLSKNLMTNGPKRVDFVEIGRDLPNLTLFPEKILCSLISSNHCV